MNIIVNSSDPNDYYSFFLPIVSLVWKKYMQYEPRALLLGTRDEWMSRRTTAYVLDHTERLARVTFVKRVPSYKDSTVMQTSRLFGCVAHDVSSTDYVLTSDVDMIPLNRSFFNEQDPSQHVHLFGANAYHDIARDGLMPPKFPMCFIGMSAEVWKDILGVRTQDLSSELVTSLIGRGDVWDNDEMYFAGRLMRHPFYSGPLSRTSDNAYKKGSCQLILREWAHGMAVKRVDRQSWGFSGSTELIDCHSVRPGYTPRAQSVLSPLLRAYFPGDAPFFSEYVAHFLALKAAAP